MLPSFRLIAATFLCSFLIAFVGLRLAATSRVGSETTGFASNPLPLQLTGADAAADMRRLDRNAPAVFDLRFAMGATPPVSVPSGLTLHAIDRAKRESGIDFPEQPAVAAPETVEANIEAKPEPKIEVAALPEPTVATADAPPPPPGPPAALAALETNSPDVESVGSTQAATTEPVVKKPAVAAKRKAVKKRVVKRARAKQAQTTDPSVSLPDPFQR